MTHPIRVVVADDSPFVCRLVTSFLQASSGIDVVASVLDGARAIEAVAKLRPDVVTLDLEMPHTNGLEAVRQIMAHHPTPIVVVSGVSGRAATMTMQALDDGAVDFVLKYQPGTNLDPDLLRREIITKVRQAAAIHVVRTVEPVARPARASWTETGHLAPPAPTFPPAFPARQLVVIGASTGGPVALRQLLSRMPADSAMGLVVVQHIPASFTGALASQLQRFTELEVREAESGSLPTAGTVLIAPGGVHLLFGPGGHVVLKDGPEVDGHRPSIDVAMQSAAQTFGARSRGVILTGMGRDGVSGLLAIRARGGTTFAQDEATCVVYGMPRSAIESGLVDHVGPPWRLAELLTATPTDLDAAGSLLHAEPIHPEPNSVEGSTGANERYPR